MDKNLEKEVKSDVLRLRKKCQYSEFFWSVFFHIPTEDGDLLRKSPYSVQMRENKDQNNSEYGHLLHGVKQLPKNIVVDGGVPDVILID